MSDPERNLQRSAIHGMMVSGLGNGSRVLIQIASAVILTRLLPPADFGAVAAVWPVLSFALILQDFGLYHVVVQRPSLSRETLSDMFWLSCGIALLGMAILVALGPFLASAYGDERIATLCLVMSLMLPLGALGCVPQGLLARRMQFGWLAAQETCAAAAGLAVAVALAVSGAGYWALVSSPITMALMGVVLNGWRSGFRPMLPRFRLPEDGIVGFGASIGGYALTTFVSRSADAVMIGTMVGVAPLGLYDRACKLLLTPLQSALQPVGRVMIPVLSRMQHEPERLRGAYLRVFALFTAASVPGLAAAAAMAHEVVPLMFGPGWDQVAPIFAWLGIAGMGMLVNSTAGWVFTAMGKGRELVRTGAINCAACLIAFFIGIKLGGVLGLAMAYATAQLFVVMPLLWFSISRIAPVRFSDLALRQGPLLVAALVTCLALPPLMAMAGLRGVLALLVSCLISYALAALALAALPSGRSTLRDGAQILRSALARIPGMGNGMATAPKL